MECTFENIRKELDYRHPNGDLTVFEYCVEYRVHYNAPSWSTAKWYNVEGITVHGSIVDLLYFGYTWDSQVNWLKEGTYTA